MQPGQLVGGRFVLDRLAGRGGMGVVYEARDQATGTRVALKVLHDSLASTAARFTREARVLAALDHPAIVRHLGHGVLDEGQPYLAMEWLDGEDLQQRLAKAALSLDESLGMIERVAEALGVAHARGVVHRDLKPGNIMLCDGDPARPKLLDFGIARLAQEHEHDGGELTGTGFALGTPSYMSPEQARSARRIDARADVYSLGCVLFRCLTGRPPLVGRDAVAVLAKIALEEAPRLSELRPDLPAALDELVGRMLARRPTDRFADGAAVAAALRGLGRMTVSESAAAPPRGGLTSGEKRLVAIVLAPSAARAGRWERDPGESSTSSLVGPVGAEAGLSASRGPVRIEDLTDQLATRVQPSPSGAVREAHDRALAARLRAVSETCSARAAFLADGSVAAVLSASGSATDLSVRAGRCALAFAAILEGAPVVLATARAELDGGAPIGDVIDAAAVVLAKRGRRAAAGPGVLVDDVTAGLLGARFAVERDGESLRLLREIAEPGPTRTLLGKPTPFVGRDRELGLLMGLYRECVEEPIARAVLVTGAAGEGKSRLRYELLRQLAASDEPPVVLAARGDPVGAGSPWSLLALALQRFVALDPTRSQLERLAQLRERVARTVAPADAPRVADFVGELLRLHPADTGSLELRAARHDPMLMGDQIRRACEDFLAAETRVHPVVVLLEDLQWGDLPTVRFVESLLVNLADRPLLVLALARPEVRAAFPSLFAGQAITSVQLAPLTRRAAEKLARAVLGERATDAVVERAVAHAGGNAFYLEEVLRAVAEGRGDALPETVLAMLQTRVEGLEADARRVLRGASVFGPVFFRDGLAHVLGPSSNAGLDDWLDELVAREWVTPRAEARLATAEYAFRQASLREAAYASLTETDRALGHRLAGEWLEAMGDRDALAIAEHYRLGGAPDRAQPHLVAAVRHALEGNDLAGVLAQADVAIAAGVSGAALGEVHLIAAEAHRWRGENALAGARAAAALHGLPQASVGWFQAVGELATARGRTGDVAGLEACARTWLGAVASPYSEADVARRVAGARAALQLSHAGRGELARHLIEVIADGIESLRTTQPIAAAWVDIARLARALGEGEPQEATVFARRVVAEAERGGDLRLATMQRVNVGVTCIELGALAEADETLRAAVATGDRLGLRDAAAIARSNLGLALTLRGAHREAVPVLRECIGALVAQNNRLMEGSSRNYLAMALLGAGALGDAEREARASVEVLAATPGALAHALATLARVLVALGRAVEALPVAQHALSIGGGGGEGEAAVRLAPAEALRALGEETAARAVAAAARTRLLERAARIPDPALREQFLRSLPDHARTMVF